MKQLSNQLDGGDCGGYKLYSLTGQDLAGHQLLAYVVATQFASPEPVWGIEMQADTEYWQVLPRISSLESFDVITLTSARCSTNWNEIPPLDPSATVESTDESVAWQPAESPSYPIGAVSFIGPYDSGQLALSFEVTERSINNIIYYNPTDSNINFDGSIALHRTSGSYPGHVFRATSLFTVVSELSVSG